ncbi:MAG TPA: neutral/alkaline non-lysosomal ceramidase N-terminal domain-containing protein [Vicinamibacterales bacterium]
MNRRDFLALTAAAFAAPSLRAQERPAWRAGVARADITPRMSMWMAGYAARKHASQGVALPLAAKALVLTYRDGPPAVIVTIDLLGITGDMAGRIAADVERRFSIPRDRLLINASHTHSGPVIDSQLIVAYDLTTAHLRRIDEYTAWLETQIVDTIARALKTMSPATVSVGESTATFAANRRTQFVPEGPVDHRVPVLRVDVRGAPRAILFGYACHNTTLQADWLKFHGDYAGVAQAALEKAHPGATAMFIAGCGADANPKPRGSVELATQHGESLARAVSSSFSSLVPVDGPVDARMRVVDLPFAPYPDRDGWELRAKADNVYLQRHARLMLDLLDRNGSLPTAQPDPVQVWHFGRDLVLIALGGEVVVDYALRFTRERPGTRVWVAGYSNDVFGYVPSRRVLDEGGYEGGGAMLYYGRPGRFDASVEERIVSAVNDLARSLR